MSRLKPGSFSGGRSDVPPNLGDVRRQTLASPPQLSPATPAPSLMAEPAQGVGAFGFWIIALYLFSLFSRLHDQVYYLHLPVFFQITGMVAMLASGALMDVIRHRTTMFLFGLTLWMFATIPLSVWPGGAASSIKDRWLQWLLLYLLIVTLVPTFGYIRKAIYAVTLGTIGGAITSFFLAGDLAGRRVINNLSRFSDPNDFAQFLLVGMCLLIGLVKSTSNRLMAILLSSAGILMFVVFVKTGSRGGVIGLIGVFCAGVIYGSAKQKIGALLVGGIVLLGILTLAPDTVRARYLFLFGQNDAPSDNADKMGEGAAQSRKLLFINSVRITMHNPIFGVGMGMFAVAENTQAKDDGFLRGMWHETHNMYTQVSSENGLPGLLLFLAVLIGSVRRLSNLCRLEKSNVPILRRVGQQAFWLRIAMVGFLVTGAFLSVAYSEILMTLIALTVALDRAAGRMGAYTIAPTPPQAIYPGFNSRPLPPLNPGVSTR